MVSFDSPTSFSALTAFIDPSDCNDESGNVNPQLGGVYPKKKT